MDALLRAAETREMERVRRIKFCRHQARRVSDSECAREELVARVLKLRNNQSYFTRTFGYDHIGDCVRKSKMDHVRLPELDLE